MTIYDEYVDYTFQYKQKYGNDTIVLIEVGSFWEMYDCDKHLGADMKRVSEILNIHVTKKNKNISEVSSSNPLMAGFPSHALQKFLQLLLDEKYTIVLIGQVTPPPSPKRAVTQILSKGTYIDTFDTTNSNYIMSVNKINNIIGASIIDLSTGKTFVFEGHIDRFVKIINMFDPCEVVVDSNDVYDFRNAKKIVDPNIFKMKLPLQIELLTQVFENKSMLSIIEYLDLETLPYSLSSFCALISYCQQHVPMVTRKIQKPELLHGNLDVFYNTNEQLDVLGLNKVLNNCATSMGRRYFKWRLFNPFCDPHVIRKHHDKISNMDIEKAREWNIALKKVYDLERLFRKSELGLISFFEMENISRSCSQFPEGADIVEFINTNFDFNTECIKGNNEINNLLSDIQLAHDDADSIVSCLNKELNVQYFKIEKHDSGWFIPLTNKRWQEVQKRVQLHVVRGSSSTSSIKVTSDQLDELFNKFERLTKQFKQVSALWYTKTIEQFNLLFSNKFRYIIDIVCDLDFVSTNVINNHKYKYIRPNVLEDKQSKVIFQEVRHPVIEIINDKETYVGNDVTIESGKGTLLYGLNASGKSSLMKAIGLNIIMAQCGMYVAASNLDIVPYESLFARISKADNLYTGQSTFMVEMSELRKILKYCSPKSIVLADELCAGTESVSAISIVAASIKFLTDKGVSFIFATHLHELTKNNIVPSNVNIFHLDVYYDKQNDMLIYNRKLCKGQGSELYGLEVCKSLDMNEQFLQIAEQVRNKLIKSPRKSKYNSKLIVNKCIICKQGADEVHHILEQHLSDLCGFIGHIHKNKLSNLVALCKSCHDKVHKNEINLRGYKMTSKGLQLIIK